MHCFMAKSGNAAGCKPSRRNATAYYPTREQQATERRQICAEARREKGE